jgi:hypothetical protein
MLHVCGPKMDASCQLHIFTKHGRFCKQNNQLAIKSHDELKDNSIDPQSPNQTGSVLMDDFFHTPHLIAIE